MLSYFRSSGPIYDYVVLYQAMLSYAGSSGPIYDYVVLY